jgi:hypothetical protein
MIGYIAAAVIIAAFAGFVYVAWKLDEEMDR